MNINIDLLLIYNHAAVNDYSWPIERREALENAIKNHLQALPGLFTLYIDPLIGQWIEFFSKKLKSCQNKCIRKIFFIGNYSEDALYTILQLTYTGKKLKIHRRS